MMFSDTERAELRKAQEGHMMDRCRVYRFERWERDSRGTAQKVFSETVETVCGLKTTLSERRVGAQESYRQIEADAVLRLPARVEIKPMDEVEVFERFGEAVDAPHRYEVLQFERAGASGRQVLLRAMYV